MAGERSVAVEVAGPAVGAEGEGVEPACFRPQIPAGDKAHSIAGNKVSTLHAVLQGFCARSGYCVTGPIQ